MKILIITLYIINSRVLSLKNKIKKVKPPNKLPSIILLILIFLFSNIATVNRIKKSNQILIRKIKSRYSFILIT